MSENTGESPKQFHSLEPTKSSLNDEVESAKILVQEGLLEEAKKILYRALLTSPNYKRAHEILSAIQKKELDQLFESHSREKAPEIFENTATVIDRLFNDLEMDPELKAIDPHRENWKYIEDLSAHEHYDLGVAFFEMGCYRDAIRELQKSIRMVRQEQTDLGALGVSCVSLCAEALVELGEAYEGRLLLDPVIASAELKHEEKTPLYYLMGRVEEALGHRKEAKGWYEKVQLTDQTFRDVEYRIKLL